MQVATSDVIKAKAKEGQLFAIGKVGGGEGGGGGGGGTSLVCQNCYNITFSAICVRCSQRITEKQSVNFRGGTYHTKCFEDSKALEGGRGEEGRGGGKKGGKQLAMAPMQSMHKAKGKMQNMMEEYASLN